jgi:hypothetical protein
LKLFKKNTPEDASIALGPFRVCELSVSSEGARY